MDVFYFMLFTFNIICLIQSHIAKIKQLDNRSVSQILDGIEALLDHIESFPWFNVYLAIVVIAIIGP